MDHPDDPAPVSRAVAGEVEDKPEKVISLVVTDEDDEPDGLLEHWGSDAWIYADVSCLVSPE